MKIIPLPEKVKVVIDWIMVISAFVIHLHCKAIWSIGLLGFMTYVALLPSPKEEDS